MLNYCGIQRVKNVVFFSKQSETLYITHKNETKENKAMTSKNIPENW